jgi:hypothetical protein
MLWSGTGRGRSGEARSGHGSRRGCRRREIGPAAAPAIPASPWSPLAPPHGGDGGLCGSAARWSLLWPASDVRRCDPCSRRLLWPSADVRCCAPCRFELPNPIRCVDGHLDPACGSFIATAALQHRSRRQAQHRDSPYCRDKLMLPSSPPLLVGTATPQVVEPLRAR